MSRPGTSPVPLSIPVAEAQVATWAKRAPRSKQVVAYCRGPYCVFADRGGRQLLRKTGVEAPSASEDGVAEWRAAGLPMATRASVPT
jgi:rhodanese-related sulfurtransferase